jgi:hypothetical protein
MIAIGTEGAGGSACADACMGTRPSTKAQAIAVT